ncbi:GNAT family N-acetyltransferase [Candidatus Izemoplasma sp. B36]|uniref:GNAT family N-acetyltransferase n=1 Tax=Candidatus Izemoplasma sp. B36 TaxID=3242468 RepID=UPI003557B28E
MFEYLESERLTYRKFKEEDEAFIVELMSDDRVCKFLPGKKGYPLDTCQKILNYYIKSFGYQDKQRIYLVSTKEGEPIGYVGIQIVKEFDKYEIFYAFKPDSWGFGFATESSLKMVDVAKKSNLKELIALADIENDASQKVLEKIGYIKEDQINLWDLDLYFYTMKL